MDIRQDPCRDHLYVLSMYGISHKISIEGSRLTLSVGNIKFNEMSMIILNLCFHYKHYFKEPIEEFEVIYKGKSMVVDPHDAVSARKALMAWC